MTRQAKSTKLVIGAGERHLPGYIHHDIQDLPNTDLVCDFWAIPDHIKAGSLTEVQMTHVLEHFPMAKTMDALGLVYKLLKKGGQLYLECPNLYWQSYMIVLEPTNRQFVQYVYGGQHNEWDYHFNGHTPNTLDEDLRAAGFTIKSLVPNSSIECWVTKP